MNDSEGKTMLDDSNKQNRIPKKNGSKILAFAFKAAFSVDLAAKVRDNQRIVARLESPHDENSPSRMCLAFLYAFSHEKLWYSGVAFGMDFFFLVLMIFAAMGKKPREFGFRQCKKKEFVRMGNIVIDLSRVVDYRAVKLGAASAEVALDRSGTVIGTVFKETLHCITKLFDSMEVLKDSPVLEEFKDKKDELVGLLQDEFPTGQDSISCLAWVDEERDFDYSVIDLTDAAEDDKDVSDDSKEPEKPSDGSNSSSYNQTHTSKSEGLSKDDYEMDSTIPTVEPNGK